MKKMIIAALGIVMLASCKKETVTPPVAEPTPAFTKQLKTQAGTYSDGSSELMTYSFDARGRMTSYKQEYPGTLRTMAFDYSAPGKIMVTQTNNNTPSLTYECTENNQGYITDAIIRYANGSLYQSFKLTYDANGYIIKKEATDAAGIISYFDFKVENGNVTELKYYINGALNYTTKMTYDHTKYNSIMEPWGGNWMGTSFGKSAKNLVTSLTVTRPDGTISFNTQHTYQLDAAGYVAKRNYTNLINNTSGEAVYVFQ